MPEGGIDHWVSRALRVFIAPIEGITLDDTSHLPQSTLQIAPRRQSCEFRRSHQIKLFGEDFDRIVSHLYLTCALFLFLIA